MRGISKPSTAVRVRAPNSHQTISSAVATRLRVLSGQGGGCSGFIPASMITAL
ncbi:hypothetical protein FQZ97_836280 [compost metagenome]